MSVIPRYRELPVLSNGLRCSWGVFGEGDQLGTANFLTDEVVRSALASEAITGDRINLTLELNQPDPQLAATRGIYRHTIAYIADDVQDDVIDNFFLQGSTQWDGLRHRRDPSLGFYGGVAPADATTGGALLGIEHWARTGLIGRGVLVDVARHLERSGTTVDPTTYYPIDAALLSDVLGAQNAELQSGDILLLRTGYLSRFRAADPVGRRVIRDHGMSAGLAATEGVVEFLWDNQVAAAAADNPGFEAFPRATDAPTLHARLIPMLGFVMGELFDLDALSNACDAEGRYSFLFVSVPLNIPGGVGSPGNAIAIL